MGNRGATQSADGLYPPLPLPPFMRLIILVADVSLTDILTPANLLPLFNSHPDLVPALFPHLPPDLPVPPSAYALQSIIQ